MFLRTYAVSEYVGFTQWGGRTHANVEHRIDYGIWKISTFDFKKRFPDKKLSKREKTRQKLSAKQKKMATKKKQQVKKNKKKK